MSQQLELSNGTLLKLQAIAEAKGVTPEEWIEAKVSEAVSAGGSYILLETPRRNGGAS